MTTYTLFDSLLAAGYHATEAAAIMDTLTPNAKSMVALTAAVAALTTGA